MDEYDGRQYVGIDLHRRRSVIVRMTPDGQRIGPPVRIDNDPFDLAQQVASWGEAPEVVLEATYGWYWAAEVPADAGASVHLAHPLGVKGFAYRRVKNDERDAADLADLLRMGRLPEAWIAPPEVRGLREAIRHRSKLVAIRSGLKAQVHAVLAKQGVRLAVSDLFGVGGQRLLDELQLDAPFNARVASLRRLIEAFTFEIDILTKRNSAQLTSQLKTHPGFQTIQAIRGVGPVLAAIFVAEIGDVTRFARPQQLCSWAGMTPKHYESDTKVHRGRSPSRAIRWSDGPRSKPCKTSVRARSGTPGSASANDAARTSAKSRPPANSSRWSTTGCATATSVAWPERRENQSRRSQARGRSVSDPHHGVVDLPWLIPPGCGRNTPCRAPPRRRDDRQPDPRFRLTVHYGHWRTRPPHQDHRRSRRTDSAPHGIGVKTKPATRVDLRSSLDPDPLPAIVRTEPGNGPNRSQTVPRRWLTRPRSYRDDTYGLTRGLLVRARSLHPGVAMNCANVENVIGRIRTESGARPGRQLVHTTPGVVLDLQLRAAEGRRLNLPGRLPLRATTLGWWGIRSRLSRGEPQRPRAERCAWRV